MRLNSVSVGNVAADAVHVGGVHMVRQVILHFTEWEVRESIVSSGLVCNSIYWCSWVFWGFRKWMLINLDYTAHNFIVCGDFFSLRQFSGRRQHFYSLLQSYFKRGKKRTKNMKTQRPTQQMCMNFLKAPYRHSFCRAKQLFKCPVC